jgi:hypothetical protein
LRLLTTRKATPQFGNVFHMAVLIQAAVAYGHEVLARGSHVNA